MKLRPRHVYFVVSFTPLIAAAYVWQGIRYHSQGEAGWGWAILAIAAVCYSLTVGAIGVIASVLAWRARGPVLLLVLSTVLSGCVGVAAVMVWVWHVGGSMDVWPLLLVAVGPMLVTAVTALYIVASKKQKQLVSAPVRWVIRGILIVGLVMDLFYLRSGGLLPSGLLFCGFGLFGYAFLQFEQIVKV